MALESPDNGLGESEFGSAKEPVILSQPQPEETRNLPAVAGRAYQVEFDLGLALVMLQGDDLVLLFENDDGEEDDSQIVLEDFADAAEGTFFVLDGQLVTATLVLDFAEETAENPQTLGYLVEKIREFLEDNDNRPIPADFGELIGGLDKQGGQDGVEGENQSPVLDDPDDLDDDIGDLAAMAEAADPGGFVEDTPGFLDYIAIAGPSDELIEIRIEGLIGWAVVDGELARLSDIDGVAQATFDPDVGTFTILFDPDGEQSLKVFDDTIGLVPPEDSDVDLEGVTITAVARDKEDHSLLATATRPVPTVVVDAVADGGALIQDSGIGVSTNGSVVDLNLTLTPRDAVLGTPDDGPHFNAGGVDDDGSESVTALKVTLSGAAVADDKDAALLFDASGLGSVVGSHLEGTLVWDFAGTEADLQALVATFQVDPRSSLAGTIGVRIDVVTTEAAAGDGEPDLSDNSVTETFNFFVAAVTTVSPPSVAVTLNRAGNAITEDGLLADSKFTVVAGSSASDFLQTIVITGLPTSGWTFDFSGLLQAGVAAVDSSVPGQVTIVFSADTTPAYKGSFQVAPPANSDVDLGAITVTATANDAGDPGTTALKADTLDVFVDAAVDGSEVTQTAPAAGEKNRTIGLNLSIDLGGDSTTGPGESQGGRDADGSESVTAIVVTLSAGSLIFTLPGSIPAPVEGPPGTWTFDSGAASLAEVQSLVDSLQVTPPLDFLGVIDVTVTTTTEEAASVAGGGFAGPGDVESDDADNLDQDSYGFTVAVGPVALPASVSLTAAGGGVFKEDSANLLTIQAAVADSTDQLTALAVTGLAWGVSAGQVLLLEAEPEVASVAFAGGTLTIVFEPGVETFQYANLELTPPEDSDVDLLGVQITADVEDKNDASLTTSASQTVTLVVDAVLDEAVRIIQTSVPEVNQTTAGSQTIALNLDFALVDAGFAGSLSGGRDSDGSESVTSVTLVLSSGRLLFDAGYLGGAILADDGGGNWTLSGWADLADLEAAVEALSVEVAGGFDGTVTGAISTTVAELNTPEGAAPASGGEPDESDNLVVGSFAFSAKVNPLPPAPTVSLEVNGDGVFKEDSSNDVTIEAAVADSTDQLTSLVLSGLTWGVSAAELAELEAHAGVSAATFEADTLTIVFVSGVESFSYATLTLTPPEDTDADLSDVAITAKVADKTDSAMTDMVSKTTTLIVDAVLDTQALVVQTKVSLAPPDGEIQIVFLHLDFSLAGAGFVGSLDGGPDEDGSEAITSVEIAISGGALAFNGSEPDGVELTLDAESGRWQLTGYADSAELEQAIEALDVHIPADFSGSSIEGTLFITTQELNTPPGSVVPESGVEDDVGDNIKVAAFDFSVITSDTRDVDIDLVTNTNTQDQVALFTFGQDGHGGPDFVWTVVHLGAEGQELSFGLDSGFEIDSEIPVEVSLEWLSGEQILVDEFSVEFAEIDAELEEITKLRMDDGNGADGNQIVAQIQPGTSESPGIVDPNETEANFQKMFDDSGDGLLQVAGDGSGNDLLSWDVTNDPDAIIVGGDGVDALRILGAGNEIVVAELIAENGVAIGVEIFDLGVDLPDQAVSDNALILSNGDFANLGLVDGIQQIAVLGDGNDSLTLEDVTDLDGKTWQLIEGDTPGFATYGYADTGSGDNVEARVLVQIGDPSPLATDDDITVLLSNMA